MRPEIRFESPPYDLKLADGEVHVFCAVLDLTATRMEQLTGMLSQDERARAARFRFETDRARFVAGRGMLREILGRLLCTEPCRLVFSYNARGKPRLAGPAAGRFLHFNLAHSDSLAVYAVARDHEIGVDIEHVRRVKEADLIVARYFSEQEGVQWRSLSARKKTEAFFNGWTRKEAFLKANGGCISEALNQIEVSFIPGEPARLLCLAGDSGSAAQWLLQSLTPSVGYVGAVTVRNPGIHIVGWNWHGE